MQRFDASLRRLLCFLTLISSLALAKSESPTNNQAYFLVNIDAIGASKLAQIKQVKDIKWWIEADDQLLVLANSATFRKKVRDLKVKTLTIKPNEANLYLVRRGHQERLIDDVLVYAGRTAVIQTRDHKKPNLFDHDHGKAGALIVPFEKNKILAQQLANQSVQPNKKKSSEAVRQLVDRVDGVLWKQSVDKLASMNRYSKGSGVLQARDWIAEEFRKIEGLQVELQEFQFGSTTAYNVVATLPGSDPTSGFYIVGGHYDSTSENPGSTAPGAEDNASGAAGVLEMARVIGTAPQKPLASIVFITFSGEEQGLYGSYHNAEQIETNGNIEQLKGVINMDMIGYTRDTVLDCLLETERIGEGMLRILSDSATEFTTLKLTTSFDAWGSDHVPYLEKNIPSVLTIDKDWSIYPAYHRTNDLPSNVNLDIGTNILKMNTATIAKLAGGFGQN